MKELDPHVNDVKNMPKAQHGHHYHSCCYSDDNYHNHAHKKKLKFKSEKNQPRQWKQKHM
jgi:hypothetical protein